MMTSSHPELVRQLKSEVDKVVERWAQNVLARASPAQETATEAEATANSPQRETRIRRLKLGFSAQ